MVKALALLTLLSLFCSTAWSADPPLTLYDEGVKQGVVFKIDCTGAGVACTRTGTTATVDVDAGGPGGSPGGSSPQIQFNDGGSFGGVSGSGADSNGNIGIGTHTPSTKLQVVGTISATNFSGSSSGTNTGDQDISVKQNIASLETDVEAIVDLQDLQGAVTDSQVPNNITVDLASTVTTNANLTGDVTSVGNATTLDSLYTGWRDNGTNLVPSTTTDKVGIGTTTPFSDTKLTVKGGASTGTDDFIGLFVQNGITPEAISLSGVAYKSLFVQGDSGAFLGGRDVTNDIEFLMGTSVLGVGFGGTITAHPFQIRTTNASRIQVGTDGNVGIGTSTPNARLTVMGTGTGATPTQTWKNSGNTQRMVVMDNGTVGIGTAAPGQILDVVGNVKATSFIGSLTGNADTVTTNANLSGDVTSSGNITTIADSVTVTGWELGASTATTPAEDDNDTSVATTAYVQTEISGLSGGASGWTDGGTNIYTTLTTDNVGIGTTTPSTTLEIIETSNRHPIMVSSTPTGDGDILILTNDGNIGIGTTSPNEFVTLKGSTTGTVSIKTWNTNSSGLAGVKVHNSDNKGFEMVATGSGYAVPSTYGVLATAGENLSFGESDGTINLRVNSGGTIRFTPTDTPDTCDAGTEGSLYYDNSLNEFCDCDGSSWAQIDGGGAC